MINQARDMTPKMAYVAFERPTRSPNIRQATRSAKTEWVRLGMAK
jgi:hypothetical protein